MPLFNKTLVGKFVRASKSETLSSRSIDKLLNKSDSFSKYVVKHEKRSKELNKKVKILEIMFWVLQSEKGEEFAEALQKREFTIGTFKAHFNSADVSFLYCEFFDVYFQIRYNHFLLDSHIENVQANHPKLLNYFGLLFKCWELIYLIDFSQDVSKESRQSENLMRIMFFEQMNLIIKTNECIIKLAASVHTLNAQETQKLWHLVNAVDECRNIFFDSLKTKILIQKFGHFEIQSSVYLGRLKSLIRQRAYKMTRSAICPLELDNTIIDVKNGITEDLRKESKILQNIVRDTFYKERKCSNDECQLENATIIIVD
ncbi:hypothetical protein EIN_178230 [Entamoeba invadens IP1]|uniref:hypothetical protein n=1 Tax=Entamoeba invadens IP1 TaxID=370355 RepID=UPI0002C3DC91|nr:hypothetical protein EIN_178230 [Entamoeba invadens IP1]ELP93896.1 hypothetical protein EIN_178230 [Entamoeba invadens IP1]|eukprot:XP_004260667.1 hypothetical protein EIN_178230 [Entamoeba invadens IP1]